MSLCPRVAAGSTLAAGVLALALTAAGCGGASDRERVEAYCAYGSRSAAQWLGCVDHMTTKQVREYDTRAARFALDGGECPRSTYCAAWQELWSLCESARDEVACRRRDAQDERSRQRNGFDSLGRYDSPGRYDP